MNTNKNIAVIFAGGEGKRLWPISTEKHPKQLNPFFSKKTLLGETFERALEIFPRDQIVIVTTRSLEKKIKKFIKLPKNNWIIQPKNSDTGVAMCLVALHLDKVFPDSNAFVFYSDHRIVDLTGFKKAIEDIKNTHKAESSLVVVGTKPTDPNTNFGYIELGQNLEPNWYEVDSFKEKPSKAVALEYLQSNKYAWNTGMYVWQPKFLIKIIKEIAPESYSNLFKIDSKIGSWDYKRKIKKWFSQVERISFETLVTEKLKNMIVYLADYSWIDLGDWNAVYKLSKKDSEDNAIIEQAKNKNATFVGASRNMVCSDHKRVVIIGVDDLVVVETKDVLLICHKNDTSKIKEIV